MVASAPTADIADADALLAAVMPSIRRLAMKVARRCPRSVDWEDLYQEGLLAAARMLPDYDPLLANPVTFVSQRAYGAMIDYLRNKVSFFGNVRQILNRGESIPATGSLAAIGERSKRGEVNLRAVAVKFPEPGDEPDAEFRAYLRELVPGLPSRTAMMLARRFVADQQMKEIGREFGLSESRVSQVMAEAVERLREALAAEGWIRNDNGTEGETDGCGSGVPVVGQGEARGESGDDRGAEAGGDTRLDAARLRAHAVLAGGGPS